MSVSGQTLIDTIFRISIAPTKIHFFFSSSFSSHESINQIELIASNEFRGFYFCVIFCCFSFKNIIFLLKANFVVRRKHENWLREFYAFYVLKAT